MEATPATILTAALNGRDEEPCLLLDTGHLTYREVRARVSQYRRALLDLGVERGQRVALLSDNTTELIMIMAALTLLCTARVPLNARGSVDDHLFVLSDASADVLLVAADSFRATVHAAADRLPHLKVVRLDDPTPAGLSGRADRSPVEPIRRDDLPSHTPGDLAILGYTGGTTGRPKGVRSTNSVQAWMTMIQMAEWDWPDDVRACVVTPLSHSGMVLAAATWLRGGAISVFEGHFTAARFFEIVAAQRITTTLVVPTLIYSMLDAPELDSADLSSLETVFYGSAPMSPIRLSEAIRRMGGIFSQFYGQSESPMTVCTMPKRDHVADDLGRLGSCGRPVPWVEVSLRDGNDEEVPDGSPGEICVRGPLVMDGYQNLPDETAEVMRNGWLHTGDVARRGADGFLTIVDRKKDMIITGGFNVYPREIEDVLMEHPDVADVAVIGVPSARWGESVTAVVVPRDDARLTADELVALVRQRKGSVSAPKAVVTVDRLPLSTIGKVDKKALRAQLAALD